MKLYFVRHGRTEWNEEGRFQGSTGDSPLTPQALEQIKQLGQELRNIPFDAIYSSDLPRALRTAEIIENELPMNLEIHSIPAMREWNLGKLEGQKIDLIKSIYPQQIDAFRHNLARFHSQMFEAESLYATTNRIMDFIKSLADTNDENVLIIGHGANMSAALRTLLGYEPAQLRLVKGLANGSITILETNDFDHFDLIKWNDLTYLEDQEN